MNTDYLIRIAETIQPNSTSDMTRAQAVNAALKTRLGDNEARNALVLAHIKYAISIAMEYKESGYDLDDITSEATLGLVDATESFEPDKGAFTTISQFYIRNRIRAYMAETGHGIAHPVHYLSDRRAVLDAAQQLERDGKEASDADVGAEVARQNKNKKVTADTIRRARRNHVAVVSLQHTLDGETCVADHVADHTVEQPDEVAAQSATVSFVREAMRMLDQRDQRVLAARFGIGEDPVTLEDLGKRMKLSHERVRQIEKEAMGRMEVVMRGMDGLADGRTEDLITA